MANTPVLSADMVIQDGSEHHRRRWYALLILSLSLTLVIMDATIVNVAIPSITQDFDSTFRDAEWVNTIYSLVYAATLILWGKIGDQYGRRLLFMLGVVLFGVGSALVGASTSINMLILMRAIQGVGAAMLSPSTLSIVTTTFKGKERGIAFGIWGATAGVAAALGPLLGGWMVDNASWRWAFYINIPIVITAFFGSLWAIRESRDIKTRHYFDVPGILLGGVGLAAFVFGIIEGQGYGWWKPDDQFSMLGWDWPYDSISIVPVSITIGVILLGIFTWYERRLERQNSEPLFEFGLFRYPSYRYGMITGLIVNLGEIGILFALSLYLQGTKGLSAFDTGIALLPLAAMAFVGAPLAGAFSARIGPKWIVTSGMVLEIIALFILSQIIDPGVSVNTIALVLGVYGLGLGLAIAQLTNLVLYDIPGPKAGIASGGNSTIRQVGAALGIAIIGTVVSTTTENRLVDAFDQSTVLAPPVLAMEDMYMEMAKQPVNFDFEVMLGDALPHGMPAGAAESADPPMTGDTTEAAPVPPVENSIDMSAQGREVGRLVEAARSEGMSNAALAAFFFVGIGALSSLMLPNPKPGAPEDEAPAAG
ncbi:MAG: MFS transporter [Anaerolineae bacterium]|nr:MFS transporter [Anaerolineae bacterium]